MATFAELGIPFPLFQADVRNASEYLGQGVCSICQALHPHCFRLGIGRALILTCPHCGVENALDTHDRHDTSCRLCQRVVPVPLLSADSTPMTCYSCLQAGKAALTKNTEFGMVRWEDAIEGRTHGVPAEDIPGFEVVVLDEGWLAARIDSTLLLELVRTPGYNSWQDERWQICCQRPMIYLGDWDTEDFNAHTPDGNGRALFDRIVERASDALWNHQLHDTTGVYVFSCPNCQTLKAYWDIA